MSEKCLSGILVGIASVEADVRRGGNLQVGTKTGVSKEGEQVS